MENRVLEITGVKKVYDSLEVLEDISLYLKQGEIASLLGPSGCGKTTLFRMVAGLTKPDGGKIILKPGSRVGYVFQEPRLLPWKTVEENLVFVQQNYLGEEEARFIREELLTATGLLDFKDHYPAQLSGGMKQRLELIRALSIKPDLLLLDEPFKSVDTHLKIKLREMILNFWKEEGLSLFLITHDPEEAVLMADRIYLLSDKPGRVIKTLEFNKPQQQRTIKDEELYSALEEIINIFMELNGK
ncbi:MAG: sulfonate transport system ATP-binding protein [Halanaerobiales bacterium]|nr:sulfonate transport system ATP-binding protein [Halanaerobiales bacterium]